jgi:hypothetical protein
MDKLKKRNILISIAETYPGGLNTVKEYESPIIGSDSEEERKLKRAEAKAVKKIKTTHSRSSESLNKKLSYGNSYPLSFMPHG